jgi:DNA-binding response OmpR family regulator
MLVEDNEKIMAGNRRMLERRGYKTIAALNLAEARSLIETTRPDAIVLDIMLPDGSGLDFTRELRDKGMDGVPILLLSGFTASEYIVSGLDEGGDDYLTKPYDFAVLMARIEALLRRASKVPEMIVKGRLELDIAADVVKLDGIDLLLAQKEFALLRIFVQNEDRFLNADFLYEKVWNSSRPDNSSALKNAMSRLRTKLDGSGWRIKWSRREGYCFEKE